MAKSGSSFCASRNSAAASSYSKLWSSSAPRRKRACAAGEPEVGNSIPSSGRILRREDGRGRDSDHEENGRPQAHYFPSILRVSAGTRPISRA